MPKKLKEKNKKTEKTDVKAKISEEDFERKVKELSEQGLTSEKIGEKLKKEEIHSNDYKKKISEIMGNKYSPPDLINIQKKLEGIHKHIEKNRQDKKAIREKDSIFSQLRKLRQYFKIQ